MATLQGTAIKNTGYLDKVYFNTSLSTEEVIAILDTLDLSKDYFVCTRLAPPQISVWIRKRESYYSIICQKTPYMDMPFNTDPQNVNEAGGIVKTGWKTSFDNEGFGNPFEIQDEIDPADYQGNAIGSQNELLKNLISSTPFEEYPTLDEFLTGIGNAIREVKGTTDKINALTFEDEIRKFKGASGSSTPVDNGPIYEGKYRVRYFDTDGTILKIEYVESGGKTTPPDNPSYDPDYLIFAEWNYDTDNYIVEQPTDIGAIYDTVDGATYLFCRFTTKTGLNPTLAVRGANSIDWGDGTVDTNTSHTYANDGEYIIKIYGDISITASEETFLLGDRFLNSALQKCYIKNSATSINTKTFQYCTSLTSISIPTSVTSIGSYVFVNCYSLTSISIPTSVTSIGSSEFQSCYSLTSISIPTSVTSIGDQAFYYCYSLTSITIPNGVTSIESETFQYCYSLTSITIPESVTSVGSNAFYYCCSLTNYFINCNTRPTLSSTNAFSNINTGAIMWVNDSIIARLKTATNWSTYASYMKPRSWYPSLTDPNA